MKNRGFTLIEFIVGMTAGFAITVVAAFLFAPVDNWVFTSARRTGFSQTSAAMMRVMKEVRRLDGVAQIQTFTAEQFQFVDIDSNTVNIQKTGTDLLLDGDALARNVQGLVFTYLDENGAVAALKDDIRVVKIELDVASGTMTIHLESAAKIRNL